MSISRNNWSGEKAFTTSKRTEKKSFTFSPRGKSKESTVSALSPFLKKKNSAVKDRNRAKVNCHLLAIF